MPLPVHIFRVPHEKLPIYYLHLAHIAKPELSNWLELNLRNCFQIIVHEFGANSSPLNLYEVIRTLGSWSE